MYFRLGQIVSMAVLQGGVGFHIFSTSVYNYISGMKISDIVVDIKEVPDNEVQEKLQQVATIL